MYLNTAVLAVVYLDIKVPEVKKDGSNQVGTRLHDSLFCNAA